MQTLDVIQALSDLLDAPEPASPQAAEALMILRAAARQGLMREAIEAIARNN